MVLKQFPVSRKSGNERPSYTSTRFQGCVWYGTGILGTGMDVVPNLNQVSGTGIDVVSNLRKFSVRVLMSYRTYPSFRCRY